LSPPRADGRALLAWALWDCATSPFAAIVVTFVFPAYFARAVVGDEVEGTRLWGWALGTSGLVVALAAPMLGAVADAGGRRKPWILGTSLLAALASAGLWWVLPEPEAAILALLLVGTANAALELGAVFYNALLPDLAPPGRIGRWSGWSWAMGYGSGLAALVLVLFGLVLPEVPPLGLDRAAAEPVRLAGPLVAACLLLFTLPLAVLVPDRPRRPLGALAVLGAALGRIRRLRGLLREAPAIGRFLLARLLYNDGLNTLFAFGGLYAAGTFGMSVDRVILFGILLNLTAGLGAWLMGHLDDRIGSRRTVLVALAGLLGFGALALATTSVAVLWIAGGLLGLFVGPAQAASRTLMARLAPSDRRAELFGLYALTGRITAFLGPWAVAAVTALADSQRAGMTVILLLLLAGFGLLLSVREPERG
jgi:UMF1 family MFS transporter